VEWIIPANLSDGGIRYNFGMETEIKAHSFAGEHRLELAQGDIITEDVDAIVNAANEQLMHGAGLAGAIAREGGSVIVEESREWVRNNGPVTHAAPAYTSGGKLACRYVIHAVGPVWGSGEEDEKLEAAVKGALARAEGLGVETLAMPAISTGIFGFPKERAARLMLEAIEGYFREKTESGITLVRLVLFDEETMKAFEKEWQRRFER